jgi:putative nucleotidyltransferase with HDIG domain
MELRSQEFPRPAWTLIAGMCVVGLAAFLTSLEVAPRDGVACVVYALFAFLASSQRLLMHPRVGTMSLGFLFVFAALFECGTAAGIAAAILGVVGGLVFTNAEGQRQRLTTTFYAAGTLTIAAWAAGTAFQGLAPANRGAAGLAQLLLPCGAAVTVYYAISVGGVVAISMIAGSGLPRRWLIEAIWMAPVYYAGGAAALMLEVAYYQFGPAVLVLGLPIVYVMHRSYAVRAVQSAEELRHLGERTVASERLAHLYMSIVEALSAAIEAKDQGTRLHVRRVQSLARAVGKRVGLAGPELEAVETAAVLHDIGKLAVPDHILSKPSRLTDSEYEMVRAHPEVGEAILRPIDFGADVGSIVRHHHERIDGSGYPDGLMAEQIPLGARVLGVIDVYDALVSDRPYRKAWRAERAVEYLREHAGTAFDTSVVEALAEVLASGEAGEDSPAPVGMAEHAIRRGTATKAAPDPRSEGGRALSDLACRLASEAPVHTCVLYEVNVRNAEISAVAVAGDHAECFAQVRAPLGMGPSATAARTGRPIVGHPAAEDLACVADEPPEGLKASTVAAMPITTPSGRLWGVVSLYSPPEAAVSEGLLVDAAAQAGEAVRRLEAPVRESTSGDEAGGDLLEYAAFLTALNRQIRQGQAAPEPVAVMIVGVHSPDAEAQREFLFDLAKELRLCGRGQARVVEREAAGEIVALFPPEIEPAARACVQEFEALAREAAGEDGPAPRVDAAVGSAAFPDDADGAYGLISLAETRMARSRRAAEQMTVSG